MQNLEKDDIQGLIVRGYGKLPAARFLLLKITDSQIAKKYLYELSDQVNTGSDSPEDFAIHVAFTSGGLRALGLPDSALRTFSREFREGMSDEYRAFILGDQNNSDPVKWNWGGPKNDPVHMLLLLYAKDDLTLEREYNIRVNSANFLQGVSLIAVKATSSNIDNKEHFGFRDGITQPKMEGLGSGKKYEKDKEDPIKAGEFVLGYRNEYDRLTDIPTVLKTEDIKNILPVNEQNLNLKDLGRNGSYLVYREIEQDVFGFWKYLEANSKEVPGNKTDSAIKLGAKMVGRWPGGAPLVLSPEKDDSTKSQKTNFKYWDEDPKGYKCPLGAHIRRSNPRDQLFDRKKQPSIEMIRKHMLLRRGRAFGKPLVHSMKPDDIFKLEKDDGQKRGLHFICLNADISKQFEFVQSVWLNSSKFAGLYNETDPITGARINSKENTNTEFTCPAMPVRTKYKDLPQFTTTVGGAYFFLPGIKALKFIASV
jgi:Dyp-type peroxidase family